MNFSVLMSVYNGDSALFLEEALNSIYWQTFLPNEIVLVLDGPISTDLHKVIEKFRMKESVVLKTVPLEINVGLGLALARGLHYCKNDYIARMDSDDICKPNRFELQLSFLKNNTRIDMVGSWIDEFVENKQNVISQRKVPEKHQEILKYMKGRCPFNHPTVVFKKNAVIKAGNYKPFLLKEDIYLWLRLAMEECQFANIQKSLLLFRTTKDMYKRRGGMKYAKSELKILKFRYKSQIISLSEFLYFTFLTIPIRLAPNWVRTIIYTKFLR